MADLPGDIVRPLHLHHRRPAGSRRQRMRAVCSAWSARRVLQPDENIGVVPTHLACRDGLDMASQMGVQRVWLESDCQELVKQWQAGDNQRSSILPILKQIQDLSLLFQDFMFSYISRTCNRVAHTLAKRVTKETQVGWWQQTSNHMYCSRLEWNLVKFTPIHFNICGLRSI